MNTFIVLDPHRATFKVDTALYSKSVLTKVLYWLSDEFIVSSKHHESDMIITLETTQEPAWEDVKSKVARLFTDYQMREVIETETKDIRNILYLKAFANVDELLIDDEEV